MSLFFPDLGSKKSYVEQFPELASEDCFKQLKGDEPLFVWLYASKESPFSHLQGVDRIEKAYQMAFKGNEDSDRMGLYLKGKFPSHVREACDIMARFDPDVRSRALMTAQKMFANLVTIGSLNIEELIEKVDEETGEKVVGWDDMAKYTTTLQKVREEMPHMVKMLEESMGFNMKVKSEVSTGKSVHQIVMERKRLSAQ